MNLRKVATAAAMHVRDLGRRRTALAILVLLPLVFYLSVELPEPDPQIVAMWEGNPEQRFEAEGWLLASGAIGSNWAIAVAAMFVMIGSRRADLGLLLAGYRPTELLAGRVLTALGLAAVIVPGFTVLIWRLRDVALAPLAAAIALSAVVAVATGVTVAALVPREMEGVLVIIGVFGVQMSSSIMTWMPLWGTGELLRRAAGLTDAAAPATAMLHSLGYAAALLSVGALVWSRRVRLHPPVPVPA